MNKLEFNIDWTCNGTPVTLPHDAQITEKRGKDVSNGGHGYFPGGVYTYEKTFTAPAEWAEKMILVEFEGVYKNAAVSLNGQELCFHPYGYTNFFVELQGLKLNEENTLTVVADNSKLPNSRWYSGSGIYRPVWLYICEKEGLRPESVKVETLSIAPAVVRITSPVDAEVSVYDGETCVASGNGRVVELTVPDAKLWSAETPHLYRAAVANGADSTEVTFGIRQIEWSNKGLFINGKETLLRGGCVHHDNGILGAATFDESEERRVRILKENGFNAIRSSHNPASRALLEACDRYGMYVMDETFDMWYNRKNPFDYGCDFETWYEKDVTAMVERDYNHPSVILYSIGNEVGEPAEAKGLEYGRKMIDLCHRLDPSRPVTCGANLMIMSRYAKGNALYKDGQQNTTGSDQPEKKEKQQNASLAFNIMASFIGSGMNKAGNSKKVDELTTPFLDSLDIAGYNYASGRYPLEEKAHPNRVLFGSETFPQDIYKNWEMVKKYPYLVGDFMWTGWDYLGEAGIGAWSYTGGMPFNRPYPWVLAGSGVIDILGDPDGSCKYASVVWGQEKNPVIAVKPVNHPGVRPSKSVWRGTNAMLSWSYQGCDGNKAEVEVYSDQPEVELIINGKSAGRKKTKECKAIFKVKYASGTVAAAAYDAGGRETGRSELSSADGVRKITVSPEKKEAGPGEILYVPVCITGENGIIESNDDRKLSVTVEGGELLAFGSANPCTEEQYHIGTFTTYYGRALAIVRAGKSGQVTVKATDGKETAEAAVMIR
ncbi:MAG: DUF4982 domain-containing protein [Lachnospiraceae bacterium]|nr:DUF4982 domain-containing protein [Lachnospiraceae bacterium]